jgi:murein DD-endopeptidase MepM/ murein hydrolase activator NlpD
LSIGSPEPKRLDDDPATPERDEAIVIPIHGKSYTPPSVPLVDEPITRRPSAPAVPIGDRPWRLLIVPPTPGAPTRALHIRKWQAKLAAIAIGVLVTLAALDVIAVVLTLKGQDPVPTAEEEARLRDGLLAVTDSITLARQLATAQVEYEKDSIAAVAIAGPKGSAKLIEARKRMLETRKELAQRRYVATANDAPAGKSTSALDDFPVIGVISSLFNNARRHPILHIIRPHLGVDVAARYGSRIVAPANGKVTFVGKRFGYGLVVEMDHGNGIATRYAHCSSVLVREGQDVARGALIATVGSSGLTTGPHLHYEVTVNGRQVDPIKFKMPQADSVAVAGPAESTQPQP